MELRDSQLSMTLFELIVHFVVTYGVENKPFYQVSAGTYLYGSISFTDLFFYSIRMSH